MTSDLVKNYNYWIVTCFKCWFNDNSHLAVNGSTSYMHIHSFGCAGPLCPIWKVFVRPQWKTPVWWVSLRCCLPVTWYIATVAGASMLLNMLLNWVMRHKFTFYLYIWCTYNLLEVLSILLLNPAVWCSLKAKTDLCEAWSNILRLDRASCLIYRVQVIKF